jgi:predicted alpha/beta-hydrolase family hydrolase
MAIRKPATKASATSSGSKSPASKKPASAKAQAGFLLPGPKAAQSARSAKPITAKATEAAKPSKPDKTNPSGHVILAHGAGGHKDHAHMLDLAEALSASGLTPHRFNFPYRAEGRSFPDHMPVLVESYRKEAERILAKEKPKSLILAGHSMGTRAALALAAAGFPCRGLILFSYPLHPPGHPEKLRLDHLEGLNVPVLILSGTKDAFCTPKLMEKAWSGAKRRTHHWIEGGDHGLKVPKGSGRSRAEVMAEIEAACRAWLSRLG